MRRNCAKSARRKYSAADSCLLRNLFSLPFRTCLRQLLFSQNDRPIRWQKKSEFAFLWCDRKRLNNENEQRKEAEKKNDKFRCSETKVKRNQKFKISFGCTQVEMI
jgi:hypothetical protein